MNIAIIRVIGICFYLYLIWRNMKEEYDSDKMISFGWWSFFWFLFFGRIFFGVFNWGIFGDSWINWLLIWTYSGFSYFGGFLGVFIFSWWYTKKREWKFYSFLENLTPNFLWLLVFLFSDDLLFGGYEHWLFVRLLIVLVMIFLSRIFRLKYRSWTFYKSGKKGFVFLSIAFVAFLTLSLFSLIFGIFWVYSLLYFISSLLFVTQLVILGEICQKK